MKSRSVSIQLMISIYVLLMLVGCSLVPDKTTKSDEIIRPVQIQEVKKEERESTVDYLGVATVNDERYLFTDKNGIIETIKKSEGQLVKQEEAILTIKTSDQTYDILSDREGLLKSLLVKTGDTVEIDEPICVIGVYNHRVSFGLTSEHVKEVKVGTRATVTIGDKESEGRICQLSPYPDESSRTFATQIEMVNTYDKEDYIVGDIAAIKLILGREDGYYLKIKDVYYDETPFVYLMDQDNKVKLQAVTIQGYTLGYIRVSGLVEGDKIIVSGTMGLKEGQRVYEAGEEGDGVDE